MKIIVSINRNPAEPLWKAHLEDEPDICAAGSFPVVAIGQLMIKAPLMKKIGSSWKSYGKSLGRQSVANIIPAQLFLDAYLAGWKQGMTDAAMLPLSETDPRTERQAILEARDAALCL